MTANFDMNFRDRTLAARTRTAGPAKGRPPLAPRAPLSGSDAVYWPAGVTPTMPQLTLARFGAIDPI
jgi:hypothetical protein